MKCENCKKNEATVRYTEIINGEKREMHLCEECSHELGIDNINLSMPIDFSSFFGGLLDDEYDSQEFMPLFPKVKDLRCDNCNTSYEDFINSGKFGCEECYNVFANKIDSLLRRIHGSNKYMGRKALNSKKGNDAIGSNNSIDSKDNKEENCTKESKLNSLQNDLKKAIQEERYEDAAKIRDEIKEVEKDA